MQSGNTDFIYKNELDKVCIQHDMAYGKSLRLKQKELKILSDKAFKIMSDPNGYQRGLAPIVYKFF